MKILLHFLLFVVLSYKRMKGWVDETFAALFYFVLLTNIFVTGLELDLTGIVDVRRNIRIPSNCEYLWKVNYSR